MTPKEALIQRFRELCDRTPGGVVAVAEAAKLSSESLTQVYKGYKLESGEPRGIGPKAQRMLDAAFPGWSGLPTTAAPAPAAWPFSRVPYSLLRDLDPVDLGHVQARLIDALREVGAWPDTRSESGEITADTPARARRAS